MTNQTDNLPGVHPPPPADLFQRELPSKNIPADTIFYRVHQTVYEPIYFGSSGRNRFDVQEGIIYLGADEFVAFRETIGRFSKYRLISTHELEKRRLTEIISKKDLSLVDLTGAGLTYLDADSRLFSGDYNIAQQWSEKFSDHPQKPDGIYYRSRHDPSRYCLALYRRSTDSILAITKTNVFLSQEFQLRLGQILDEYQYGLV